MPWSIQMTGTTAAVGTAVNALTVPASEGSMAASELSFAKTYIGAQLLLMIGPVRLIAFGKGQSNNLNQGTSSVLRVDIASVRLNAGGQILSPPPDV